MSLVLVKKGDEPLISDAMDWLASKGLPARLIKSVDLHAKVGDVMSLTVKLFVDVTPDMSEALRQQAAALLARAEEIEAQKYLGPGWEVVK
jgi:uncharacterized HAD superfamily protein